MHLTHRMMRLETQKCLQSKVAFSQFVLEFLPFHSQISCILNLIFLAKNSAVQTARIAYIAMALSGFVFRVASAVVGLGKECRWSVIRTQNVSFCALLTSGRRQCCLFPRWVAAALARSPLHPEASTRGPPWPGLCILLLLLACQMF